jgi:uncharacterized membrane protein
LPGNQSAAPLERLIPWLLPALFLLPTVLLTTLSIRDPWFTNRAGLVYHQITLTLGELSLAAALILLWPPLRERVAERLDAVGALTPRRHLVWLAIVYAGIWSFYFYVKYCQYRGFQLFGDTAATLSMAYNVLHGFSFENSFYGANNFAIHFQPIIVLYAPFLLFGSGAILLLAVQCAIICSAPIAVYGLVYDRTRSASVAMAGLWLCLSSPFTNESIGNNLETHVNLAAFFLWSMFFAGRRRWRPAGAFFVLAAMSNEHSMFAFFGVGLYLLLRRPAKPKDRSWGAALCAVTACLFMLEMLITYSFPETERLRNWPLMYGHLGATPGAAIAAAIMTPLHILKIIAWPPEMLLPPWRILWTTGFFCLLSPAAFLAWFVNYVPCLLATPGTVMQKLGVHYAAQVAGPIWWAMALGLSLVFFRLAPRRRTSWLLVWALLIGAINIADSTIILLPDWLQQHFVEGPKVVDSIPPDAAVWAPEPLTPWLGARSRIRTLAPADNGVTLQRHGFLPDYIVFNKMWFKFAEDGFRKRIAALILKESYAPILNTENFIVFKHPHYPLPRDAATTPFELPQPIKDVDFNLKLHYADPK